MADNEDVQNFDEIRPYRDGEVNDVMRKLAVDPAFLKLVRFFYPDKTDEAIGDEMRKISTNHEFQAGVVYPVMQAVLANSSDGFTTSGFEELDRKTSYLFISNHRDIILDPALLNYTLYEHHFSTTEIAIGDNLLIEPWIEKLVKLNKSFIVHRSAQGRESLFASQRLSAYVRSSVTSNSSSIWIAQKEGRTKDGDDKTQASLLKMLNMSGTGDLLDNCADLNIVPVSLCYEYDPCDVNKLWEMRPEFAEITVEEDRKVDVRNMINGVQGRKGQIHFTAGTPINDQLYRLKGIANKNDQWHGLAEIIDRQIYQNYKLFPCNYIAYDWHSKQTYYADAGKYNAIDVADFEEYLEGRLHLLDDKIDNLKEALVKMYAFPVINYIKAQEDLHS
jgi:hypothetical protein